MYADDLIMFVCEYNTLSEHCNQLKENAHLKGLLEHFISKGINCFI